MRQLPATLASVAAVVKRLLAERGPMTEDDLVDALEDSDLMLGAPADEILEEVLDTAALELVVTLHDGRWAWLPGLVEGRVMTHRVTATELRHGVLAVSPDLDATLLVADDAARQLDTPPLLDAPPEAATHEPVLARERLRRFVDGTPVVMGFTDLDASVFDAAGIDLKDLDDDEYVLLPPGILASLGVSAGDLVCVTLTPNGWAVERLRKEAPNPDPTRLQAPVRAWLDSVGGPTDLPSLVWWLLDATDAFTAPELPLDELLPMLGLVRRGDVVAGDDVDLDRWQLERQVHDIAVVHGIAPEGALAVAVLVRHIAAADDLLDAATDAATDDERLAAGSAALDLVSDRDGLGTLTAALVDPDVAGAFLAEAIGSGSYRAAALGLLAESLMPLAPSNVHPALHWLVAKAHERTGDVLQAEGALRTAAALAPWPPALRDLARYAADRGNAGEAAALLRRSGASREDGELAVYEHFASMAATDLGRNRPCWCGSGRKYKVCHLGREALPLDERAAWLYQKAGTYLNDGPWRHLVIGVATERARWSASPEALYEALGDGLVADAVLFEGGVFEAFLAERGALLPDDEVTLGQQWLLVDRSVHEVEAVRPGSSLTMRDVRTGDVHTVREQTASRTLRPGALLCARVLPAGDTMQLFGAVAPVSLQDLDDLIALLDDEPGPAELVALLTRRLAPPQLQNTEGEPLALHEVELHVADPARLAAHLDRELGVDDDDDPAGSRSWHATVDGGRDQLRAVVHLAGDTVQVEVNSDARFERIMATLRGAGTALTTMTHQRRTAAEMAELAERFPDLLGPGPSRADLESHPEVAAAIADLMRRYEDEWLDQPVPALNGLTPRAAVADPTRRGDVVRLLRSWPEPTPDSMDRDRIARMLGLAL